MYQFITFGLHNDIQFVSEETEALRGNMTSPIMKPRVGRLSLALLKKQINVLPAFMGLAFALPSSTNL